MPDTMIERVARIDQDLEPPFTFVERLAIAALSVDYPEDVCADGTLTEAGQIYWHRRGRSYADTAVAILTALGEPDAATLKAGAEADAEGSETNARDVWQAMLGAALAEGE